MKIFTASEAQAITSHALDSQDSYVGKVYAEVVEAIKQAAQKGMKNTTFEGTIAQLNSEQYAALKARLEQGGFRVAYNSSYQGSYMNVNWGEKK